MTRELWYYFFEACINDAITYFNNKLVAARGGGDIKNPGENPTVKRLVSKYSKPFISVCFDKNIYQHLLDNLFCPKPQLF